MNTSSRYAIALEIIRNRVAEDPYLQNIAVLTKETLLSNSKANVYINIISDDVAQFSSETTFMKGIRELQIGIYAVQKNPLDSGELGTASLLHGTIAERIDKVVDNVANDLPYTAVTDAGYTVTLRTIETQSVTGYVDDKSDKVALLYQVSIRYMQS